MELGGATSILRHTPGTADHQRAKLCIEWANTRLFGRNIQITKINQFVQKGVLSTLLKTLSREEFQLKKSRKLAINPKKACDNQIQECLDYLEKDKKLFLRGITVQGLQTDHTLITRLIITVILFYDIEEPLCTSSDYTLRAPDPKELLLKWINKQLVPQKKQARNFSSDWDDGILLGALINSICPCFCVDWRLWLPQTKAQNITKVVETFTHAKITNLLTATRLCFGDVDEICMVIYLAQFIQFKRFRDSTLADIPLEIYDHQDRETEVKRRLSVPETYDFDPKQLPFGPPPIPGSTPWSGLGDYESVTTDLYEEPVSSEKAVPVSIAPETASDPEEEFWKSIPEGPNLRMKLREKIKLSRNLTCGHTPIGDGHFGVIYPARYRECNKGAVKLAAKTIRRHDPDTVRTFLQEALTMLNFDHDNVLKLEGFVVQNGKPYILVLHMDNGDLLYYVRHNQSRLTYYQLMTCILHVTRGMKYLSSLCFVHRDLAARNCMVDHDDTVKIGDFGLTRDILCSGQYRMIGYDQLPLAWTAPEVHDSRTFTTESDVWSFGVLCWEVLTGGKDPKSTFPDIASAYRNGRKLPKPVDASQDMYELMKRCWDLNPQNRLSFGEIKRRLEEMLGLGQYAYDSVDETYYNPSISSKEFPEAPIPSSTVPGPGAMAGPGRWPEPDIPTDPTIQSTDTGHAHRVKWNEVSRASAAPAVPRRATNN